MNRAGVRARARAQRGLTLTELMVVIAIVGILVTTAGFYLRPEVTPIDVANRLGDMFREANRRAVALGPVRADVALNIGTKARTRVRVVVGGSQPVFMLERLREDAAPAITASWIAVMKYGVPSSTLGESWAPGVGPRMTLTLKTNWTELEARCYPDGTCDPHTLFFEAARPGAQTARYARMSVMPLGGSIMTRRDWN